jgi:hypothetical protein
MAGVWLPSVINRFKNVCVQNLEREYYGPYNKLLNAEFDVMGRYTIAPLKYPLVDSQECTDFFVEHQVEIDAYPILLVKIKAPSVLLDISSRQDADEQMRKRLVAIHESCPLDRLVGISAFGTYCCVYVYDKVSRRITPNAIPDNQSFVVDVATVEKWSHDLLEVEGAQKLKDIFSEIVIQCNQLS